jgi:flavin-dependent dehydrogenase
MSESLNYDVIIGGGGPAGASAAIHLAKTGARVLLAEQKKFPRPKLCGEFISPECATHFERLGVAEQMFAAGPATLDQTVFYARGGNSVSVPSAWFGSSGVALGLSRAEMDERLLRRAQAAGVDVLEEAFAANLFIDNHAVQGLTIRQGTHEKTYRAPVTIDATGRARALTRHFNRQRSSRRRPPMVAFKAHLEHARVAAGACEIYFYASGYGGLSSIENGLSNLCFIASARDVRACDADADRVMREIVCQNQRARWALANARPASPWLAVALEGFGRHDVAPAAGLLAIGDAASFIDPFTGSGMLMALESGELASKVTSDYLSGQNYHNLSDLAQSYTKAYQRKFNSRLTLCSLMRRAAFTPGVAEIAIKLFRTNGYLRRRIARATRGAAPETYSFSARVR